MILRASRNFCADLGTENGYQDVKEARRRSICEPLTQAGAEKDNQWLEPAFHASSIAALLLSSEDSAWRGVASSLNLKRSSLGGGTFATNPRASPYESNFTIVFGSTSVPLSLYVDFELPPFACLYRDDFSL